MSYDFNDYTLQKPEKHMQHPIHKPPTPKPKHDEHAYRQKYFDLRILVKQLRQHEINGVGEDYPFKKYVAKRAYYQKLVDDFIKDEK